MLYYLRPLIGIRRSLQWYYDEAEASGDLARAAMGDAAAAAPAAAPIESAATAIPSNDAQRSPAPPPGSDADRAGNSFVFDADCVRRLDGILRRYQGTHAFHNFTVKVPAGSPEAKRYILTFNCTGTFELDVSAALLRAQIYE